MLICRAAGKALLLACSQPCRFRHEPLASTPCKWQPWHPELLRVRESTGAGAARPCLEDPEKGQGMQGRSRALIFSQSNPRRALHPAPAAAPRSLCWDGERVPPCAQQQPRLPAPAGLPGPSPACGGASSPGRHGGTGLGSRDEPSAKATRGRWAEMLRVKERRRRSL